ncbi:hypothetical protein GCM10028778_27230 [Barrientosiimonas marina]|uniref:GIY-YIG domain-containing protein n=1 Tax=Lentibacillus kimchii TaxID=1542911 RepID=A0ABW2USC3_9BACI
MPIHFGVTVFPGKWGLKLTREKYALINKRNSLGKFKNMLHAYEDEKGKFYTDEWCLKHQSNCLRNFDLHMKFYHQLNHDKFESEIQAFKDKYPMFQDITDLNNYDQRAGYYVMILDEYCQVYVGTSGNIKERIRKHWGNSKPFDRLLFPIGAVDTSVMSIDSFRSLDTTRILVYETEETYTTEDEYISFFSPEFISNRISGGKFNGSILEFIEKMITKNRRDFSE